MHPASDDTFRFPCSIIQVFVSKIPIRCRVLKKVVTLRTEYMLLADISGDKARLVSTKTSGSGLLYLSSALHKVC